MRKFYVLFWLIASFSPAIHAETILYEGALTQGGMLRGQVPTGYTLFLNDVPVAVSSEGYFVLGFGRDADLKQQLKWCKNASQCTTNTLNLAKRTYNEQYVEGVPQNTVNPPESVLARIRSESTLVRRAREQSLPRLDFLQAFIAPLDGPVTGVYGSRRVYNGVPKRPHYGVDYAAPVGAPVIAPADGVVTLVHNDMYYSGGTLIIDNGFGFSSTFIHLSEVMVSEQQQVEQGDVIAKVGKGGRSTGPHLDWRINWHQVRLDPQLLLELGASAIAP